LWRWRDDAFGLMPALSEPADSGESLAWLETQLRQGWSLDDAEISVKAVEQPQTTTGGESIAPFVEVSSPRIFLDAAVVAAARTPRTHALTNHIGITRDT